MTTLVFGDSLVDGLPLPADYTLAAHPGATTHQLRYGFPSLEYYLDQENYSTVVLLAGTNDLGNNEPIPTTVENLLYFASLARSREAQVVACTLIHDDFNEYYQERAPVWLQWCTFLDEDLDTSLLEDDAVHLTAEGRRQFAAALSQI